MTRRYHSLFFVFFFSVLSLSLSAQTAENCTNGIDDDGDGLIDCYDQDCTCTGQCEDFYYTTCNADCYYIAPCNTLSLGVQWQGQAETGTYSTLVAGDMDADGIPDVVTYRVENAEIYIIDGQTGVTKQTIICPSTLAGGTAPAIADLDHDGFGELVIVANDRRLYCYEHNGALKYTSNQVAHDSRYRYSVPNIADFDHDGWAEVNIGNEVYNGQTGALLASGGTAVSAGEHPARVLNGFSFNMPVAIDALPDNFCPDCAGLEIVAGNQVLSVNLQTGVVTAVVTAPAPYSDGYTSVVDFDRDGDLDAIVQGKKGNQNTVYCWEIETPTIMREYQLLNNWFDAASRVNVADLNGDGDLEISFVGYPWLYALRNNFTQLWRRSTNDASSITCSSVFDFCGDGSSDVIYRGQTALQVIEGATGIIKWQDACLSATHIENPLVLDVDADGQTEIVIECGSNGSQDFGTVVCYEAVGSPGISSRQVWNQHAYFNTNINDDLSVPRYQQNPHIIGDSLQMNTFLNQYFNPTFPSPDGGLSIESVSCRQDSMDITLTICNNGDNLLPPQTPVSIYRGNPRRIAAAWVGAQPLGFGLLPDSCRTYTFAVPRDWVVNDSIFLALNDDHSTPAPYNVAQDFPVTAIGECEWNNNFGWFIYNYHPAVIELGPDTTICDNEIVPLDASGTDLVSWLWQDGATTSNYTAPDAGTFAVTVADICGVLQIDTMRVYIDSSTVVQIGPDRVICQGETIALSEDGFEYYNWKPSAFIDCFTCPAVVASPIASGPVILEAGFFNGCRSTDTVWVTVHDTFNIKIDTTVCFGRTVTWNGIEIFPDQSVTFDLQSQFGCDSTVQVRVHGTVIGTYQTLVDTAVCANRTLDYLGFEILPGEQKIFNLSAVTGCDSTVLIHVIPLDTFATQEVAVICSGETYPVFGQPQTSSGVYKMIFPAVNGCDSTHTVNLTVLPQIDINLTGTPTCINEATGTLTAQVTGGESPYNFAWSAAGAGSTAQIESLWAGDYALTVTDANDCTETATGAVPAFPPMQYELAVDSVRCYGEPNGAIRILTEDATLQFSLDNAPFLTTPAFERLASGPYTVYALDGYGCSDTTDLYIWQPDQMVIDLPPDTSILLGDSVQIHVISNTPDILRFQWSTTAGLSDADTLRLYARPTASIQYALTLTDARGCTATDKMTILIERIRQVFVPNALMPQAANTFNAVLTPGFGPGVEKIRQFSIYDRWGDRVHQARNAAPGDPDLVWDGLNRDRKSLPGVYVWIMEVELSDGSTEFYRGDVSVIR